jgi:hypothetical protein
MMFSISRQFGKITMPKLEVWRFTYSFLTFLICYPAVMCVKWQLKSFLCMTIGYYTVLTNRHSYLLPHHSEYFLYTVLMLPKF